MNTWEILSDQVPSFLVSYAETDAMIRLKNIDMNCGMNYTSFPLFHDIEPYSRYDHSLGTALIIWNHTHDKVQTLAGLFHDISTPAFSHVVDFMQGDYISQEATEQTVMSVINDSNDIKKLLKHDHILIDQVSDYHQYPIADNQSPRLSADRLEYTLGDILDYRFGSEKDILRYYKDIVVLKNEDGINELGFLHADTAEEFALKALQCGMVYSSKEDRYAMQRLAEILKRCLHEHILSCEDLYQDEPYVISEIQSSCYREEWDKFTRLSEVCCSDTVQKGSLRLKVKKRWINPLTAEGERVYTISEKFKYHADLLINDTMNEYLKGNTL